MYIWFKRVFNPNTCTVDIVFHITVRQFFKKVLKLADIHSVGYRRSILCWIKYCYFQDRMWEKSKSNFFLLSARNSHFPGVAGNILCQLVPSNERKLLEKGNYRKVVQFCLKKKLKARTKFNIILLAKYLALKHAFILFCVFLYFSMQLIWYYLKILKSNVFDWD